MLYRLCRSALVLLALVASPALASAQEYRATLTGLVNDAQGLALPGVTVTATHVETGTTHHAVTEGNGAYTFALLQPGDYTVAAQLEGFARLVREKVRLNSGQRVTLDLKLEVGSMTESVTVKGEAALLSTGTASVGVVSSGIPATSRARSTPRRSTPFPRSSSIATSGRCRRTSASSGWTRSTRSTSRS